MAQTNDSQPTWPIYNFRVNLETLHRYDWLHPNRTQTAGNETVSEEDNLRTTRSTWTPGFRLGNRVLKHGSTFTAKGKEAVYLKKTYATGDIDALLVYLP